MNSMPPIADIDLRRASLCQLLHWLAVGRVQPQALADAYQQAIERLDPALNAYVDQRSRLLQEQAHMADRHRRDGVIGRLHGIPLALPYNFDMAGRPTRGGPPRRRKPVPEGAH